MTCLATVPPTIESQTFSKYGTLHVLPQSEAAYKSADYWKNFTIVGDAVLSDGIEDIKILPNDMDKPLSRIYDLSGRHGNENTTRGVYIRNGKKYLVK